MEIYLLSSVNFIIYLLQILSLNINLVTQQNGYRHYHLPLHVKIHAEIKWLFCREKNRNSKIFDSRSFNSNITRSNHKPVVAEIQIKWTYTKKAACTKFSNLSKLQNLQITKNYVKQVNEMIKNKKSTAANQEGWNNIIKALKTSAEKNLGCNHEDRISRDANILSHSSIQKDIYIKLNSNKDEQKKK